MEGVRDMVTPVEISVTRRAAQAAKQAGKPAWDGVSVFMLPSDLPVSLSPHDIAILHDVFARQPASSLWCGFTLLGETRMALSGEPERASRAVLFAYGAKQPYFSVVRWLDGNYVLADRDGNLLRKTTNLVQLLSVFEVALPTVH